MRSYLWLVFLFACCPFLTKAQTNVNFLDSLQYDVSLNDIWGYTDSSGNEYALVGLRNGTSIVDVSDSTNVQEVAFVSGPSSTWRDIKVWDHYAYVVTENSQTGGMLIINLSGLPGSVVANRCGSFTAHNIFIDEKGYAYLFGYNGTGGAIIADVASSPTDPQVVGYYNQNYVHDGFVRNDTMWTAEIFAGQFAAVDVSDRANPQVLTTQKTPHQKTHNVALSANGNTLFTTDETTGAYIAAYGVSDLSNIQELDRYQSGHSANVIPHNAFMKNGYLVNSYYTDGITIVDAHRPSNLIEVGHYDTSPQSGNGFNGSWGVYPFFQSGVIVASDIEEGLFVLQPGYTRACYLEGEVLDSASLNPVDSVQVAIHDTASFALVTSTMTGISGKYKTGVVDSGVYHVRLSGSGCDVDTVRNVKLTKGNVTIVNDTLPGCQVNKRSAVLSALVRPGRVTTALHGEQPPGQVSGEVFTSVGGSLCDLTGVPENQLQNAPGALQARPTLFQDRTKVRYRVPLSQRDGKYRLLVYDGVGQLIQTLPVDQQKEEIVLGQHYETGIYFVRLQGSSVQRTIKIIKINRP